MKVHDFMLKDKIVKDYRHLGQIHIFRSRINCSYTITSNIFYDVLIEFQSFSICEGMICES